MSDVAVLHFMMPGTLYRHEKATIGERIGEFLHRINWAAEKVDNLTGKWCFKTTPLPTICLVNGKELLRRFWKRRRIRATDQICFVSRPQGGNNKQILGIVALIAIAAVAWFAGPAIAAGLGLTGTIVGSLTWAQLFTAAIALGGSLAVNTLTAPSAAENKIEQGPQAFSLTAAGNTGRLQEIIPVGFGRLKTPPDWAIIPWSEFIGNETYYNILLVQGMGKYAYEQVLMDDTPIWDSVNGILLGSVSGGSGTSGGAFHGGGGSDANLVPMEIQFCNPGEPVTLFPANITGSIEVQGQEITTNFSNGVIVNAAGTQAFRLAVDLLFAQGLFEVNNSGKQFARAVGIAVEARTVDNAGAPLTAYTTIINQVLTYNSREPVRVSLTADVAPGRYQVRIKRQGPAITTGQGADMLNWAGLRAYLKGTNVWDKESTIALRIRASETTQGASRRFFTVATRKLNVWDINQGLFVEQPTRNPLWAAYDLATNETYGLRRSVSRIDFQELVYQAQGADLRGDHFDYQFRSQMNAAEVLDLPLRAARCNHRWLGHLLSFIRDEWKPVPQMILTDQEIVRDSLQIGLTFNDESANDSVIIQYLDSATWSPAELQYPENTEQFTSTNPMRLAGDGIVERTKINEFAAFYWNQHFFRRQTATLNTEYDGRTLSYGSVVRVQSEMPQVWGQSGEIINRNNLILTLRPAPTWDNTTQQYIRIRDKQGRPLGPVKCARGANDAFAVLDAVDLAAAENDLGINLAAALAREQGSIGPSFELGTADNQALHCLVMNGEPNGDQIQLSLVEDLEEVHGGPGQYTPFPPIPSTRDPNTPIIFGLNALFGQNVAEPRLSVSWIPAPGAFYYIAEISYDGGATFSAPVFEGQKSSFSVPVTYSDLIVRVRGIGTKPGPWAQTLPLNAPSIKLALAEMIVSMNFSPQSVVLEALADAAVSGAKLAAQAVDDTKIAAGIAVPLIVNTLPNPVGYTGRPLVWLSTDKQLYRYDASVPRWTTDLASTSITGQLTDAQLSQISAAKIAGQLSDAQLAAISAAKITGQLTDAQIAAIAAAKVTGQLTNAQLAAIAASKITGQLTDAQLAAIGAAKITGQLTDAQLVAIAATKVTGQLIDGQLAAIGASKVTGQLIDSQLAAIGASKITGLITDAQLTAIAASKITGQLTDAQIAALAAAKLTGQLTTTQISDGAVTTPKIFAGAVVAGSIASSSITASKFVAGTYFENIVPNGSFEEGTTGWTVISANTTKAVWTDGHSGNSALWLVRTATNFTAFIDSSTFPIIRGQSYELTAYTAPRTNNDVDLVNDTFQLSILFLDVNGTYQGVSASSTATKAPGSWTKTVVQFSTPDSARYAFVRLNLLNGSNTHDLVIDDVTVRRTTGTTTIEDDAISTGKIQANAITAVKILAGTITSVQISTDTIQAGNIAAGAIQSSELATGAVTAGKIFSGSIVSGDIAAATILGTNIFSATILTGNIGVDTILAGNIAAGAIQSSELATGAVTAGKIFAGTIVSGDIAASTILGTNIFSATILTGNIGVDTILAGNIAAGAIQSSELATGAVTAGKIFSGSIVSGDIAAATILGSNIFSATILTGNIGAGTIVAGNIAAGTITGSLIAGGTITGSNIFGGTITGGLIAAAAIGTLQLSAGAVTTDILGAGSVVASKLAVGSFFENAVPNGAFEDGIARWSPQYSGTITATGNAHSGTQSLLLTRANGGQTAAADSILFPVVASQVYEFSAWSAPPFGSDVDNVNAVIWPVLLFCDTAGNYIGSFAAPAQSTQPGGWQRLATQFTVPANATRAFVRLHLQPGGTALNVLWDDISVRKASGTTLIEDGSITTTKILALAVIAGKIAAGAINAQSIIVNELIVTDHFSAGAAAGQSFTTHGDVGMSSVTTPQTVASVSQTIKNGTARIAYTGYTSASVNVSMTINVLVDNNVVRSYVITIQSDMIPIVVVHSGLSNASHTFGIQMSGVSNTITFKPGVLEVSELRKPST